ncbi:hypothetical protein [Nostoc linckia]|nr:hypothetical protein [Nostoc linckia]
MVRQAHQPGKGKRNKFNLPLSLLPMPNAQCPIPDLKPPFLF